MLCVAFENSAALRIPVFPNTTLSEAFDICSYYSGLNFS